DGRRGAKRKWVKESVRVKSSCKCPSLCCAVTDYDRHEQVRIVERSSESVRDAISQFASFMHRAGGFRSAVAPDAAWERKIPEERTHSLCIFALAWVNLGIGTLQVDWAQHARSAMSGSSEEDGVEVVFLNKAIEMNIGKAQTRTRAPVSQQSLLDVLRLQRFTKERILLQINHAHSQVIACSPIGIYLR